MRVDISADEYAAHARHMEFILKKALADTAKWTRHSVKKGWSVDVDRHGWRVCSRSLSSSHSSPPKRMVVCLGCHHTTLSSIREGLYADNSRDYLAMAAVLHGSTLFDAAVLNVHSTRTKDDPGQFLGVKSLQVTVAANKPPLSYLFLEFSGTCVDPDGRVTFFVLTEPILAASTSCPTEAVSCVKLYRARPDSAGVDVLVRAHFFTDGSAQQHLPKMTAWRGMSMTIQTLLVKDVGVLLQESSLYESLVLTTGAFAPEWDFATKRCNVCEKKCQFWNRHHHCRCCGHVMCGGCLVKLYCVDRSSKSKQHKSVKKAKSLTEEKFCMKCWVRARGDSRKPTSPPVQSVRHALDTLHPTMSALETLVRVDAPNTASIADWWKSARDEDSFSNLSTSWMSTCADPMHDLPLSTVSASYRSQMSRINSFNLLTASSSKEEIAARMDEVNESIALQTMMLSTMTNILTPRSPPASFDVVEVLDVSEATVPCERVV
ncbi:hypothetical protein H310_02971 [Aphanomyces invadans]|uniref:FYVE-type domain-containing protein n=1 Tax=Aphanomyces invadans TaxID=157072 RepID=A0A024UKK5_9STRA|nr:hypothetical protein H310_02971 [Aphanomyces invadans]ETW06834.1 hypothetical protein H310_02971 [Aphanomyces invadans]|eukprot:XP_008864909.1 hypothetical protein H310_02971 [Aphanomyces invadans]